MAENELHHTHETTGPPLSSPTSSTSTPSLTTESPAILLPPDPIVLPDSISDNHPDDETDKNRQSQLLRAHSPVTPDGKFASDRITNDDDSGGGGGKDENNCNLESEEDITSSPPQTSQQQQQQQPRQQHNNNQNATISPPPSSEASVLSSSDIYAELKQQLAIAHRCIARLHHRHHEALELNRTHGQRLLRAHYEHKLANVMDDNVSNTTAMLNQQKKCFEDELELMESEARAREATLRASLDEERAMRLALETQFQRERDDALEKTDETMQAVQRKLAQLHARATRVEMEKAALEAALRDRGTAVDALAAKLDQAALERRRTALVVKNSQDERDRKDKVIEALQQEISGLRERLGTEEEIAKEMQRKMKAAEDRRVEERTKFERDVADAKLNAKKESDRLGALFGSVIQDFANAQTQLSTDEPSRDRPR